MNDRQFELDNTRATDCYRELNRRLYRSDPADYFRRRLRSVRSVEARHVTKLSGGSDALVTDANDEVGPYIASESLVLLHQVAETVVRWHLAHAHDSPCPWLELSAERHSALFSRRVEEEILNLDSAELEDDVAFVFFGVRPPAVERRASLKPLALTTDRLRTLAARFLSDAQVYNAAKHGMALIGGRRATNDDSPGARDGSSTVTFLSPSKWMHDERNWTLNIEPQDVSGNLALVESGADMLEALWTVASARYFSEPADHPESDSDRLSVSPDGDPGEPVRIHLFSEQRPQ